MINKKEWSVYFAYFIIIFFWKKSIEENLNSYILSEIENV